MKFKTLLPEPEELQSYLQGFTSKFKDDDKASIDFIHLLTSIQIKLQNIKDFIVINNKLNENELRNLFVTRYPELEALRLENINLSQKDIIQKYIYGFETLLLNLVFSKRAEQIQREVVLDEKIRAQIKESIRASQDEKNNFKQRKESIEKVYTELETKIHKAVNKINYFVLAIQKIDEVIDPAYQKYQQLVNEDKILSQKINAHNTEVHASIAKKLLPNDKQNELIIEQLCRPLSYNLNIDFTRMNHRKADSTITKKNIRCLKDELDHLTAYKKKLSKDFDLQSQLKANLSDQISIMEINSKTQIKYVELNKKNKQFELALQQQRSLMAKQETLELHAYAERLPKLIFANVIKNLLCELMSVSIPEVLTDTLINLSAKIKDTSDIKIESGIIFIGNILLGIHKNLFTEIQKNNIKSLLEECKLPRFEIMKHESNDLEKSVTTRINIYNEFLNKRYNKALTLYKIEPVKISTP